MRSFKSQIPSAASVNDENNARNSMKSLDPSKHGIISSSTSGSSDRREVLGDVTQLKNEQPSAKQSAPLKTSSTQFNSSGVATTNAKIQIYKQQHHQQFKKPRIENILQRSRKQQQRKEITIHSDATDEEELIGVQIHDKTHSAIQEEEGEQDDGDDVNQYIVDEEETHAYDIEDQENIDPKRSNHHSTLNGAGAENYHNNSEDILIRKHFDKLTQADLDDVRNNHSSLSPEIPAELLNNSDLVDDDVPYGGKENYPHFREEVSDLPTEEIEEEEELKVSSDKHKPMEPIWSKSVYAELQYIIGKYSRLTLDENDEDTFDVSMAAEYAPEIFNYMHELENRLAPDASYMENQDELKWEMRSVLIDWVVQVHSRFNLLPETLFLTVNYIDRFLSKRKVSLSRFQLVGAVALFIAAKYEEINCPTVQEVAYMADNAYSIDDFLKAERFMIDVLEFDMGWPGPMSFLRRTSKADDYDYETRTLAKYFLEITIMDSRFVASQPSWLAAGAHYLSRRILNKGDWSELHVFYSGYTEAQLRPLAEVLLDNCRHAETHHKAIFEKYQERRYRRSSAFVQEYFDSLEY